MCKIMGENPVGGIMRINMGEKKHVKKLWKKNVGKRITCRKKFGKKINVKTKIKQKHHVKNMKKHG